ncbi:MAG: SDR family NAD(P)-dependent oxidoreductase [Ornithinimicrobium sp.]
MRQRTFSGNTDSAPSAGTVSAARSELPRPPRSEDRRPSRAGSRSLLPVAGQRVLVTGGSSGIGMALARALAGEGVSVVITGREPDRLASVAESDPLIEGIVCDVTDDDQVRALGEHMLAAGGLDMLINCAGVMHFFDVRAGFPLQRQLQEVAIDVEGPMRMVDAFLPDLLTRPSTIVNVSSGLAWVPYAAAPVYSGAKAFVHAWTISLRHQLKDTSVRVVEILPPVVDTPLAEGLNAGFSRMSPDDLVAAVMAGLRRGQKEISPGSAVGLKYLSRLAPRLIFGILNREASRP